MQLMNSEKSLTLGIGGISKNALESEEEFAKNVNKKSVDYDDTDFLQKMFSNGDNEIKDVEPPKKNPEVNELLSKKMGAHENNSLI